MRTVVKKPNINFLGLSTKVTIMMLITLGILFTILIGVTHTTIQEFTIRTSHEAVLQEARRIQVHITEAEQSMLNDLRSIAMMPGLTEAIKSSDLDVARLLLLTTAKDFDYHELDLYDENGEIILYSNPVKGKEPQEQHLISFALLGIEYTSLIVDDVSELRIGAASPLRDTQGNIIGAIFVSRYINAEFLNEAKPVHDRIIMAVVSQGELASEQHYEGQDSSFASIPLDPNLIALSLSGQSVTNEGIIYTAGQPYTLAYSPLTIGGETNASILTLEDIRDRMKLQNQVALSMGVIMIVLAGVTMAAFSIFLRRMLIGPLSQLAKTSEEFGHGNLSIRAQQTSRDEIGVLAGSFNHMADELKTTMEDMDKTIHERTQALETLSMEVKAREQIQEQLHHDAFHDALTGLPNRALFFERLEQSILRNRRNPEHQFAVMFLDLDRFKLVNDSMGHNVGDELLITVAKRLSTCMREVDTVARMGGDEFGILLADITQTEEAEIVAERIHASLGEAVELKGKTLHINASLGIVVTNSIYKEPEDYLRDADLAMYHAKKQMGKSSSLFSSTLRQETDLRVTLEADLRNAIEQSGLILNYQPIFDINNNSIIGCEALLRWMHPQLGIISPGTFIPLAEETGLIIEIGYWVIETACQQANTWAEQFSHLPRLNMSVNVSAKQLVAPDFADNVLQILEETCLPPTQLSIEVTESTIITDADAALSVLSQLKESGIAIHMDDFGTGYSALGQLRKYPLDHLKIDRSFIDSMNIQMDDPGLVRAIISMAKEFDLRVIAEGVETEAQLEMLSGLGCDFAQGFLYSKPLAEVDMAQLLAKGSNQDQILARLAQVIEG